MAQEEKDGTFVNVLADERELEAIEHIKRVIGFRNRSDAARKAWVEYAKTLGWQDKAQRKPAKLTT